MRVMKREYLIVFGIVALAFCAMRIPVFGGVEEMEPVRVMTSVNRSDAIFKAGEEIVLTLGLRKNGEKRRGAFLDCRLFINGSPVKHVVESADEDYSFRVRLEKPGWVAAIGIALDENKKPIPWTNPKCRWDKDIEGVSEGIGAMVEPERIQPAAPEPEDFVAFWNAQRAELKKVPLKSERADVSVPKEFEGKVRVFDVKVDCAGGAPVTGYLSIPPNAKPKSLPAIVYFRGWGFYTAEKHLVAGESGIAFELNAHGIENGREKEYYKAFFDGPLGAYQQFGKKSRETYYFRGMYLRVMRALEYVKSLPEWNGKDLLVYGGSKGGGQAIAAAGLDPDVSLCVAFVPAMGDHAGCTAGRQSGWPGLYSVKDGKVSDEAAAKTAHYFDNNNFARHIKCPVWLATGFMDFTCPPTSVYTVYNTLAGEKHMETFPSGKHSAKAIQGFKEMQKVMNP